MPGIRDHPNLLCRCADAEYYWAEIIAYNKETGKHKVKYADRFTEDLHLPVEKLDWGPQVGTLWLSRSQPTTPCKREPTGMDAGRGSIAARSASR